MTRFRTLLAAATAAALLLTAMPAQAEKPWVEYKADKFGFSMSVPKGTTFKEKDWKNGWGGVYANYWGVQLWGVAQLGKKHKPGVIETFGALVTQIPFKQWKIVDKGEGKNGFEWHKVARSEQGNFVVFAVYGVGAKGSYLVVLKTTKKSYAKRKDAYDRWYGSVRVF